jgi:putative membrane protein
MFSALDTSHLIATLVYAAIGIFVLAGALTLLDRLTPFHVWKEILEEHNVALAILLGCMSLGLSLIIAASILG